MGLLITSIIVFLVYVGVTQKLFGITPSISASHYKWREKGRIYEILFTLFCWGITFTVLPIWLDVSPENVQFLAFLSAAGLGFVGASPLFMDDKLENTVHSTAAILCITASFVWAFIAGNPLFALAMFAGIVFVYFKIQNKVYWAEIIAFIHLFTQIFILL